MFGHTKLLGVALFVVAITVLSPMASAASLPGTHAASGLAPPLPGAHYGAIAAKASTLTAQSLSSPALTSRLATQQRVLDAVRSSGVPMKDVFLPNFHPDTQVVNNVVSPGYSHTPAPVGVAAYGVMNSTGTPTAMVMNTPSFEGQLTVDNSSVFYLDDDSTDYFGTQLNTVLYNVTLQGNSSNEFWTQNVISYSARSDLLQFLDNIWNFSSPAVQLSPNVFENYSANGSQVGSTFYYGLGPVVNITMPFTVDLYNNASVVDVTTLNATNVSVTLPYDEIWYNYSVYKSGLWVIGGSYDWAIFNSQNTSNGTLSIPTPEFQVNGQTLTNTGFIPDDAELVVCGPGGGSTTSFYSLDATMNLWWWNLSAGAYQQLPSAFNFGSETGETAQGVATWYDGSNTVHLDAGPTLPTPMWGMSPTAAPGFVTISGTVSPANAFVFLNTTANASDPTALNPFWESWVPVPASGQLNIQVPAGNYTGEILLSNYDPTSFNLDITNASTWTINGSLIADSNQGIYTPLFAWSNAELGAISTGGTGTAADPYQIANDEFGDLAPVFAVANDYFFPNWPGILIAHTTAHVDINDAAPFSVSFGGVMEKVANAYGLPLSNQLGIQLYGTQYVSIVGAPLIGGWFSANQQGYPLGEILVWNSSHTLIANNNFVSEGNSLTFFGGTDNTISGNWFNQEFGYAFENGFAPEGLWLSESGDLIYNNYFATTIGAYSPSFTPYTETFYNSNAATWVDQWNVSLAPATWINNVNGYVLSGSIAGGTWIGGNWWLGYNGTVPWTDFGFIAYGGDWLPLTAPSEGTSATLTFTESGLPAGTNFTVWVNGIAWTSGSGSVSETLASGTYTYAVAPVAGLIAAPSSGAVTLSGTDSTVAVTFSAPSGGSFAVSFVETGLPAGTAWTVTLAGTPTTSQVQVISYTEPNGSYAYSVSAPAGYNSSVGSGTAVVAGSAPAKIDVTFVAYNGFLTGIVTPSNAELWVDGAAATVSSAGAFNVSVAPGVHMVEIALSGYTTVFNNYTVTPLHATAVAANLQSTSSGSSSSNVLSGSAGVVVALLAVLVVIFLITTLYLATTRRAPVMMKPETSSNSKSDDSDSGDSKKP